MIWLQAYILVGIVFAESTLLLASKFGRRPSDPVMMYLICLFMWPYFLASLFNPLRRK